MLHPNKQPIAPLMHLMGASDSKIYAAEIQYRKIHFNNWSSTKETESFWSQVLSYQDASGSNSFKEIAGFAIWPLIMPHSNAEVEQVFSGMNIIKTNTTRLALALQQAIWMRNLLPGPSIFLRWFKLREKGRTHKIVALNLWLALKTEQLLPVSISAPAQV